MIFSRLLKIITLITFLSFPLLAETPIISTNSDGLTFTNIGDGSRAQFYTGSSSDKLIFTFSCHSFYLTDFNEFNFSSNAGVNVYGIASTARTGYDTTINLIVGYGYNGVADIYDNQNSTLLANNFDPEPETNSSQPLMQINYKASTNTIRVSYDDDSGYGFNDVQIDSNGNFSRPVTFQSYSEYTLTQSSGNCNNEISNFLEGQSDMIFQNNIETIQTIHSRMNDIRMNSSNKSKHKVQLAYNGDDEEYKKLLQFASNNLALETSNIGSKNIAIWSQSSIQVGGFSGVSSSSKTFFSKDTTVGMDLKINNQYFAGIAIRDDWDELKIETNGTYQDFHTTSLSTYHSINVGKQKFIDLIAGYGDIKIDLDRYVSSESNVYTGSRSGDQVFGSINFNAVKTNNKYSLNPFGRFDANYTKLKHYDESSGSSAIHYQVMHMKHASTAFGMHFERDSFIVDEFNVTPFGLLEYGHDISRSSSIIWNYLSTPLELNTVSLEPSVSTYNTQKIGIKITKGNNLNVITSIKNSIQPSRARSNEFAFSLNYTF